MVHVVSKNRKKKEKRRKSAKKHSVLNIVEWQQQQRMRGEVNGKESSILVLRRTLSLCSSYTYALRNDRVQRRKKFLDRSIDIEGVGRNLTHINK